MHKLPHEFPNNLKFFYFNKSPLNMTTNVFYFILKPIFIFKIFTFWLDFFGYVGNWLDKKFLKLSKFMISQTGSQTISINILPDISKSKGNQIRKIWYPLVLIKHTCSCATSSRLFVTILSYLRTA